MDANPSVPPGAPHGVCPQCNGLGKDCSKCHNDAYCTKCASDPKRVPGHAVPYIIKTPSFVLASECVEEFERSNASICEAEGRVCMDGLDAPKDDLRLYSMSRSHMIKVKPIEPRKRLEDMYVFSRGASIGKGSYGTVSKVRCVFSEQVRALKTVLKSKIENITRLKREILIMKRLDHPGIIRLHEVFEDDTNLYLVMELCTGGELFERVVKAGKFSEPYAAKLIRQVLSVLAYIHSNNIIHRDLKPENLLYIDTTPQSKIKVIDWGFALKCNRTHPLTSVVGTPYYVAPEVLYGNYGATCDIWSIGVILFITLCGYPPFYGHDNKEILKKVKAGEFTFEQKHWSTRSRYCRQFIEKLLTYDRHKRVTAREALSNPWIMYFNKPRTPDTNQIIEEKLSVRLALELYRRFQTFANMNPIKRLAVTATAYMISGRDLGQSTQIFNVLDRNGDGVLTRREIVQTFSEVAFEQPDIDKILALMDTDGNGTIDYTEFLAATIDATLYACEKLSKVAFRVFDLDLTGVVTAENIHEIMKTNYGTNTDFKLEKVYGMMEGSCAVPGQMTYEEFHNMLTQPEPEPVVVNSPRASVGRTAPVDQRTYDRASTIITQSSQTYHTTSPAYPGAPEVSSSVAEPMSESTQAPLAQDKPKGSFMTGLNRAKTLLRKKERENAPSDR